VRSIRILFALLLVPSALACKSECSKQSDCNLDGGESCLWPTGVGCGSVKGHCEKQNHCQSVAGAPTLYCSCSGVQLALECTPNNGITEQTTNGMCTADGGGEIDPQSDASTESDAGAPGDAGTAGDVEEQ
jgi:hypothetical protein